MRNVELLIIRQSNSYEESFLYVGLLQTVVFPLVDDK